MDAFVATFTDFLLPGKRVEALGLGGGMREISMSSVNLILW